MKICLYLLLIIYSQVSCSFQIALFNKLNSKYKENNLIISPLSIFQAISLVTNGANGETQKELLKLLDNKEMEEINMINSKILEKIKENSSLEMANAIMSRLAPLNEFTNLVRINYESEILPLKNANQVNKWCEKKTHGRISKIIEEIDPMTYMLVLNAIYFKGEWRIQFENELTKKQKFYNLNKDEKKIDTMEITKHFNYFEDTNLQAIELEFRKESISALIILPNKKLNINEFVEILDKDNSYFYSIIDNLEYKEINLRLPKFELDYNKSLKEVFKTMGINLPFENNADFSKIRTQNDIYINDIKYEQRISSMYVFDTICNAFNPKPEPCQKYVVRPTNLEKEGIPWYDIILIIL